jgi:hypothetical protein
MDAIPANGIERIEIYKTLSADQDADGIGGTVNIVTPTAQDKPTYSMNGTAGYNPLQTATGEVASTVHSDIVGGRVRNSDFWLAEAGIERIAVSTIWSPARPTERCQTARISPISIAKICALISTTAHDTASILVSMTGSRLQ